MDKEIFNFFTTLIEKVSGISYGSSKEYLVESRLLELAQTLGYRDLNEFYLKVKNQLTTPILNSIVDALTINETCFFRDTHPFEALRTYILPELFQRKNHKKITIWSAACSTGQEPYSIAMLILEYFFHYLSSYEIKIWATDISLNSLKKAKEGVYNQIEVNRGLPINFLLKYFTQEGSVWKINEKVKSLVKFDFLNLLEVDRKVRERFDIIFCRYVLIYFSDSTKKKIWENLWKFLNPGGYLILGGTELAPSEFLDMERKVIGKTTLFYKKEKKEG